MINCGAVVDVRDALGLSFDQSIRCFIIDSHRPVHLANLHGTNSFLNELKNTLFQIIFSITFFCFFQIKTAPLENVLVFDDGIVGTSGYPVS